MNVQEVEMYFLTGFCEGHEWRVAVDGGYADGHHPLRDVERAVQQAAVESVAGGRPHKQLSQL